MWQARILTGMAVALAAGGWTCLGEDAASRLEQFKEVRAAEQEKIEAARRDSAADLHERYSEALSILARRKQASGELEPLLAVRQEIERYAKRLLVNVEDLSADVPELKALQTSYLHRLAGNSVTYWESVLALATRSEDWLARLQTVLTQKGDVNGALAAKAEREATGERKKVAETHLLVARRELTRFDPSPEPAPAETARVPGQTPRTGLLHRPGPRFEADEKNVIRRRYREFSDLILKDDWDAVVQYVEPATAEKRGTDTLKFQLRFIGGFLRLERGAGIRERGTDVTLHGATSATLIPRVRGRRGTTREGRPVRWIKVDDTWYVKVD